MNNRIRAIIIDDEANAIENLENRLISTKIDVVATASNVETGYAAIVDQKPQLIFLDIAMPNESGFDLINRFDNIDFEIIFVTAFDEYAIEAIEACALGYVLKPIDRDKLSHAIKIAEHRILTPSKVNSYEVLKDNLAKPKDSSNRVVIKTVDRTFFLKIEEIIRFESDGKYTNIFKSDGTKILSSNNLSHYVDMLSGYRFFQCHKSHFVSLDNIDAYFNEGFVKMTDESSVPVSRRKKAELLEILGS